MAIFSQKQKPSHGDVESNDLSRTNTGATLPPEKNEIDHDEFAIPKDCEKFEEEEGLDYSGVKNKTDPVEIALVRKLDMYIMPTLWIMYWLNYLDRNAIALARLNSLEKDLNLTGSQYQTCVSILFVGYLLGQVPSNLLITRIRPSYYMASAMAVWAVVSTLTGISQNFTGLLLTRFFLGITESPYYPGALYILSIFYTRKEIATRISILYTGNILATSFAGLIAAGIFEGLDGVAGQAGWRWLFYLQGVATFLVAILGFFFLPDRPLDTKWLTPEQRTMAHERVLKDAVVGQNKASTMEGLRQAVVDPRLWLFAFMQTMHLAANGFKNFFPTVVKSLGFSDTVSLLLTCPPYLIAGIISVLYSVSSGRYNERTWHITVAKAVAIIGFILACSTLNTGLRYFAMVVFCVGTYAVNSIVLGWVASTLSQSAEKKSASLAIVMTCANATFIVTPYLFPTNDKPRYVIGMTSSAAFSFACAAAAWGMRIWLQRMNRSLLRNGSQRNNLYAY